jgi:trans-aconitate methyltransferase
MSSAAEHWNEVYESRAAQTLSWFEAAPTISLELVETDGVPRSVIDVGSGESLLVDTLIDAGVADVTLLDVSSVALEAVRERLAPHHVHVVCSDVLEWQPQRQWQVWHDRAVFHFLTGPEDRRRYAARAATAVEPGGTAVIANFASDGPTSCSGRATQPADAEELAAVFADHFELELSRRETHLTPSGVEQPFTWVVLRRHR